MLFNGDIFGNIKKALTHSLFNKSGSSGGIHPPPGFNYLIDNDGDYMIDNDDDYLIDKD